MTNRIASCAALGLGLLVAATAHAGVVREDIVFLHSDGRHYTAYKALRSDIPKWRLRLGPGERPRDYVYIHPDDYEQERVDGDVVLIFEPGSYALMNTGRFTPRELERGADGRLTHNSWDGKVLDNGHYGKWTAPGNFERFTYIWVVPDNIEIVDYRSNSDGDWTKADGTLVWSGRDVNDLTFDISYRVRQATPAATPAPAAEPGEVEQITLDSTNLFPSGSHELTTEGEDVVLGLADRLRQRNPDRVIVAGHTDDQPLKPYLRKKYPSNWELSAARATMVVRRLAENGVDPAILEARAYGEQRPVASNDSAAGRARNRRIEILVEGGEAPSPESQAKSDDVPAGDASAENREEDREESRSDAGEPETGEDGGFAR